LPFSIKTLRQKEIAAVLVPALARAAAAPPPTSVGERTKLEVAALIACSLDSGRSLPDLLRLPVTVQREGPLTLSLGDDKTPTTWCWMAIEPAYDTTHELVDELEVQRDIEIRHRVHPIAEKLLRLLTRQSPKAKTTLFRGDLFTYQRCIKTWLRELDPTGRLTINKITRLKFSSIAQSTGGDFTKASLALGLPHQRSTVPLYYSALPISTVSHLLDKASATIWDGCSMTSDKPGVTRDAERYTGCRALPTLAAVQTAVGETKEAADRLIHIDLRASLPPDFTETFNLAVLYLLWHQFYAIATRAIRSPYIPLAEVSEHTGIATLADKDSGTGYKTRFVWISPGLRRHMHQMERLTRTVRKRLSLDLPEETEGSEPLGRPIFFLTPDNKEEEITPASLGQVARSFFPFPVNTPRRVMRTLLTSRQLTPEMIDTFMGHWRERQEPWGKWSTFSYRAYLAKLRQVIPELLCELGFEALRKRTTHG
jgi:hypothetical protein